MKAAFTLALLGAAHADVYMHNPRGSNNRNCRNDNNENRRNGNRLFDSQNNNKGGYSCPRSYPFDCYKYDDGSAEKANCQAQNTNLGDDKGAVNNDENSPMFGELTNNLAVMNERMTYYVGETITFAWTSQHGSGLNEKVGSQLILQVACEDTLTDFAGTVRDGTPINNNDDDNTNDEATTTIDAPGPGGDLSQQDDGRYGRHETLAYYRKCKNREANKGLWIADQAVNRGLGATATRQNPNGNRNGLECKEECDYYPYWHDSPWKDIAILTSNTSDCAMYQAESQNVKERGECVCEGADAEAGTESTDGSCTGNSQLPNHKEDCDEKEGATWMTIPSYGIPAPECMAGPQTRDNHLGNKCGNDGSASDIMYNWTIPEWVMTNNRKYNGVAYAEGSKRCVVRLRYNLTSTDPGKFANKENYGPTFRTPIDATFRNNAQEGPGANPPGDGPGLYDRDNNEYKSYRELAGFGDKYNLLGFAVNTNQYARTFQDRTYTFEVVKRDGKDFKNNDVLPPVEKKCDDGDLIGMNVRGKRGNIVQAYPSVEYDFVPNKLEMTQDDCVHLQWTGSDYNPNRNPNNGEGGPPNPNNSNEGKSDRHNLVQMDDPKTNHPMMDTSMYNMFRASTEQWQRMIFNDQPLESETECLTAEQLKEANVNNRQDRERDHRNCGKLSGQKIPHLDIGVVRAGDVGTHKYMSTRNNNLSNRGQQGTMTITEGKPDGLSSGAMAGVVIGSLVVVGAAGAGGYMMMKRKSSGGSRGGGYLPHVKRGSGGPSPSHEAKSIAASPGGSSVVAKHAYTATESGELSFKKGDTIKVLRRDGSGWWEGQCNGVRGVFPSNYVA